MLLLSFASLTDEQRVRRYKPSSWTSTTTATSSVAAELESVGEVMEAPYGTRVLSPDVAPLSSSSIKTQLLNSPLARQLLGEVSLPHQERRRSPTGS